MPRLIANTVATFFIYHIGIILVAIIIGVVESILARARFVKIPQLLLSAFTISLIAIFLLAVFKY
jgi:formate hydrogenlyase subunit 4